MTANGGRVPTRARSASYMGQKPLPMRVLSLCQAPEPDAPPIGAGPVVDSPAGLVPLRGQRLGEVNPNPASPQQHFWVPGVCGCAEASGRGL